MAEKNDILKDELREIRNHVRNISWQLECMRRLQLISDGLRDIRTNAARAPIAKEGEEGYVPEESIGSRDEAGERSFVISWFEFTQDRLNKFVLPLYQCDFSVLSMHLERLLESVREDSVKSPSMSLNQIARATRQISNELDDIHKQIAREFEDTPAGIEEKRMRQSELKREQERLARNGKLPLPD